MDFLKEQHSEKASGVFEAGGRGKVGAVVWYFAFSGEREVRRGESGYLMEGRERVGDRGENLGRGVDTVRE